MASSDAIKLSKKALKRQRQAAKRAEHNLRLGEVARPTKRPDVLSMAEYLDTQRYANTKDRYTSTLPFGLQDVTSRFAAHVLEIVKARWIWYSNGRRIDCRRKTQLGTLNYLPLELRDIIYLMVFDDQLDFVIQRHSLTPFEYRPYNDCSAELLKKRQITFQSCIIPNSELRNRRNPDCLDLSVFLPPMEPHEVAIELRRASSSLRTEFDRVALFNSTFKFRCPGALEVFFGGLSTDQRKYVQRIVVEICIFHVHYKDFTYSESWQHTVPEVPHMENLKALSFEFGRLYHPIPIDGRAGYYDECTGEHRGGNPTEVINSTRVIDELEILSKQLKRRALKAEVALVDSHSFFEEDFVTLASVLGELD